MRFGKRSFDNHIINFNNDFAKLLRGRERERKKLVTGGRNDA